MGQTREELANTVKQRLNNTTVTFIAEGNSVKASLKDLGVTVDTDKTVDALLNAKTGDVAKLNIFDQPHIASDRHHGQRDCRTIRHRRPGR